MKRTVTGEAKISVNASDILPGNLPSTVIATAVASNVVGSSQLQNGSVTLVKMASNAISNSQVVNASINLGQKGVAGSVTNGLMASNSVGGANIINGSIDLPTKAATLGGLTLPDLYTNVFPTRFVFSGRDVPASSSQLPIDGGLGDLFPLSHVTGKQWRPRSAIVQIKSGLNTSPENSHDDPNYVNWIDGAMDIELWYSKEGVTEPVFLTTILSGMDKSTVDGWSQGRYAKYRRFELDAETMGANWDIMVRVTTDSHWNGDQLKFLVLVDGEYSNI